MKYSWRHLIGEPQLCEGGRLASIVFCCDPREKPCPILDEALRMLGVSKEKFIEVMEKHKIKVPRRDGSCFGNLAFCPSIEKDSRDRDMYLLEKGLSPSWYLKYKFNILKDLLPEESRLEFAFSNRLLRQFAVEMLDLETKKVYRALGMGSITGRILLLTEIFSEDVLRDENLSAELGKTEYVGVRLPKDLVEKLDELVEKKVVASRSDGIRRALALYLSVVHGLQASKAYIPNTTTP